MQRISHHQAAITTHHHHTLQNTSLLFVSLIIIMLLLNLKGASSMAIIIPRRLHSRLPTTTTSRLSFSSTSNQENENGNLKHKSQTQGSSGAYKITSPKDLVRPYFQIYYNDVYKVPLPPKHRFPMSKYEQVRKRVQDQLQLLLQQQQQQQQCLHNDEHASGVQLHFEVSPLVTKNDLMTTHCEKYIDRYLIGDQTDLELRNVGFPWSPEGVKRSLSSTGGTVAAALSVCNARRLQQQQRHQRQQRQQSRHQRKYDNDGIGTNGGGNDEIIHTRKNKDNHVKFGPLFGAHIAGGTHHAFKDRGEGFSVFSDIAVAANVVLRDFSDVVSRILIIDLDVHQGNGNAVLFQNEARVFTFSIQCKGNYFSQKEKSDLDIELPIGCNDETYLGTLHHWLKRINAEAGKFDLIFYQAGVDIIEDDRLGRMNISGKGLHKRNEMIYNFALELGIPLVITMGGGYPRKDWEPILSAHTDVYVSAFERINDTVD